MTAEVQGSLATVTASISGVPSDDTVEYKFDAEGKPESDYSLVNQKTFGYTSNGTYQIIVTARNEAGGTDTDATFVTIDSDGALV